ncbi:hypothetical protein D9T04_02845 [Proteus mirabilis]|nr:hypothetical protein [Proteus mirabilis]MVD71648.1 hypothetical protein [Proteus mirabilis]MVF40112.1 hypothetical protein [Proteus mirabilis]
MLSPFGKTPSKNRFYCDGVWLKLFLFINDTVTYTVIFFGSCQPLATIENKKATSNLLMALGFLTFINYC